MRRLRWKKEWEICLEIPAWHLTKVRNKSEVISEARNEGRKVHWWIFVISKIRSWSLNIKSTKRQGRTPRWHCKRWFCSYAVFTEHGSSATQMTAAKIISRLPGCAGHAADAVSAYTQVKMERCSQIINSNNRNVQTFGFVYHDTNGQNHGPVWKTQSFLLSEICTVILWQDCYGKGNWRKSHWSTVGRKFPTGNASSYTVKKDDSFLCMWMTKNWLERNKILIRFGKYSIKKLMWENQHLSLIMYTWSVLKDSVK